MRRYQLGAHNKTDLKVHLIWLPKYGKRAVSSGNITDELIQKYIQEQEGEPITDDSRFGIDPS